MSKADIEPVAIVEGSRGCWIFGIVVGNVAEVINVSVTEILLESG